MSLTDDQVERYARHLILREVGGAGQKKLLEARVLVVGAGGLGSPALLYLAAAGIGTIGIVDADHVALSNLQRQIAHATPDIGRLKVESASDHARAINPDVHINRHATRIGAANALELVQNYDVVLDGSDNFATRFLVNDACYLANRTLVSAAVGQFDGQLAVFKAHDRPRGKRTFPCYRCLYPEAPPPGTVPSCTEAGILGALTGVMGTLQALEALKEILQIGETMAGRLMLYDGLGGTFRTVKVRPDPDCALCGPQPSITDLDVHADQESEACAAQ
ncbi:MAG: molybdopterin-synthase adenylyltransferase MoeB [Alphaproteobacteria bacterium]|nr:molybdopterin-synthase adenylyltransferase MoeB [Alphaproteobacteria bacterium]